MLSSPRAEEDRPPDLPLSARPGRPVCPHPRRPRCLMPRPERDLRSGSRATSGRPANNRPLYGELLGTTRGKVPRWSRPGTRQAKQVKGRSWPPAIPEIPSRARPVSVDLLDPADCRAKLSELRGATHVFYCAFQPGRPGPGIMGPTSPCWRTRLTRSRRRHPASTLTDANQSRERPCGASRPPESLVASTNQANCA
jgi:hypothetical protein